MTADNITFKCPEKYRGVIPEPEPAHNELPSWYENAPLEKDGGVERTEIDNSTVRACVPFFEALTTGWIIKTPADIQLEVTPNRVEYEWDFDRELLTHFTLDIMGPEYPDHHPIFKFIGFWSVEAPEGTSALFTAPMNRRHDLFEAYSGIVNIDDYGGWIHQIVRWKAGEWKGVIPKGTPIVQMIPMMDGAIINEASIETMTEEEELERKKYRLNMNSNQRHYRENIWRSIKGARNKEN